MAMKKQSIIATVLFALISLVFLMSGYQKLAGGIDIRMMFGSMNIAAYRIPLGIIEFIIIPTLIWKPLRTVGTLIATGYLGGAIMASLVLGMSPVVPGAIMVVLWVAYKLDMWVSWTHCGCGTCSRCKTDCACTPACKDKGCTKGTCKC